MRVSTILATKGCDVATIRPEASVADVVAELARHQIGALVVSADGRTIDGIVSERDVVRWLAHHAGDPMDQPVTGIMSAAVTTCGPDADVEALMATMTDHRIRHVPVLHDGELCGIISIGDVVKSRIDELERHRRELEEYITAR
jgi:CBS domain-containing protein